MTNSEAKEVFKKLDYNCARCRKELSPICDEAKNITISALEENTKLKAEIEQFSNELISVRIENELLKKKNELTNHYFEQYAAAIDEIERLKEELGIWQSTNFKLVCELTRIECENNQLKSELEQSVRLPLTNADKIRSMSDEELAEFIQDVQCDNHGYFVDKLLSKSANPICITEMLKQEVRNGN